MKKFIIFGVVMALLVPSLAMGATEFSLGGYIKMDMMWDSDGGIPHSITVPPARTNDPDRKHGRLKFTAQYSRINFTIKGPDLWGAKTTGFIEMDFDSNERPLMGTGFTASNSYVPRMRHAMFRFNWPTSELMFGQYWSILSEWQSEAAEDTALVITGVPSSRLAQVRFTQKFMSDWTVAAMIADPTQARLGNNAGPYNANINNGQSAESPQVEGKIRYAHDFWGKAAYKGKPIPFTVQFAGGWQRNIMRNTNNLAVRTFGENNYNTAPGVIRVPNTYVNPWLAMGTLFIPVIPTQSANLAGTASILTQWWIGQGVECFGFAGVLSNKYRFVNQVLIGNAATWNYDVELLNKFGGFVQGQYYFTNQWYVNAIYAFTKTFNVTRAQWIQGNVAGRGGREMAFTGDNPSTIQQVDLTLWYRPIQALKFGLQYAYVAASYPQIATTPANSFNSSRFGDNHRVEFVGYFFF